MRERVRGAEGNGVGSGVLVVGQYRRGSFFVNPFLFMFGSSLFLHCS